MGSKATLLLKEEGGRKRERAQAGFRRERERGRKRELKKEGECAKRRGVNT